MSQRIAECFQLPVRFIQGGGALLNLVFQLGIKFGELALVAADPVHAGELRAFSCGTDRRIGMMRWSHA